MANTVDCLYTTVLNISGREAVFSFLPPHGKRMAANEQLTVAGNLIDRLASLTSNRKFLALERALSGVPAPPPAAPGTWILPPSLAIISTPAVFVMTDPGQEYVPAVPAGPGNIPPAVPAVPYEPPVGQMIDGSLTLVDPCWGDQTTQPPPTR